MRQVVFVSALPCVHTTVFAAVGRQAHSQDLIVKSGASAIACTLSLPAGRALFPVVTRLSGSGAQNGNSLVFGFRLFKLMADFMKDARVDKLVRQTLVWLGSRALRLIVKFDPALRNYLSPSESKDSAMRRAKSTAGARG